MFVCGTEDTKTWWWSDTDGVVLCRLKGVCRKARDMAEAGAYLHWYEQYGFSRDDIDSCVEACLGVVGRYEQESAPPAPR